MTRLGRRIYEFSSAAVAIVDLASARNERHPELELTDAAACIFLHYGREPDFR